MFSGGGRPSSMAVFVITEILWIFIYDESDEPVEEQEIEAVQMQTMKTDEDKIALLRELRHIFSSQGADYEAWAICL